MFRVIKIFLLGIFITISIIGFAMSTFSCFDVLFIGEAALPKWVFGSLFGIPIVFIPAIAIAIAKTVKYEGEKYQYGIRFWPAIRNISKLTSEYGLKSG